MYFIASILFYFLVIYYYDVVIASMLPRNSVFFFILMLQLLAKRCLSSCARQAYLALFPVTSLEGHAYAKLIKWRFNSYSMSVCVSVSALMTWREDTERKSPSKGPMILQVFSNLLYQDGFYFI